MRILAYTSPSRGHLYPLMPILQQLATRGHRVRVADSFITGRGCIVGWAAKLTAVAMALPSVVSTRITWNWRSTGASARFEWRLRLSLVSLLATPTRAGSRARAAASRQTMENVDDDLVRSYDPAPDRGKDLP